MRILLASTMDRSFIAEDLEILRRSYDVDFYHGSGPMGAHHFFHRARRADLAISWFASVYSLPLVLASRLTGTPSVIIVGGVDAAALPEIGYGLWLNRFKSILVRAALKRADLILAVDDRLLENLRKHSGLPLEHGRVVPTGYDPEFWSLPEEDDRLQRGGVLCVASCDSRSRGLVKGVDLFCRSAEALPDIPFTFIGATREELIGYGFGPPSNITALPPLDREELLRYYRNAAVYCQPSRHEGLPNVLCEAMLCGVYPVATDVGGSGRVVGEIGIVVPTDDADRLAAGLRQGLRQGLRESRAPGVGELLHNHIATTFPRERRERELTALIEELIGRGKSRDR